MSRGGPLALALAALLVATSGASAAEPRLVVVIVVDQLRRDRLVAELPGGLGMLARDGRLYSEAVLDHAGTATCPGHVSIATGHHPGPAGVPGNRHLDRSTGAPEYCVADPTPQGAILGMSPGPSGRSPSKIRVTALGDWLKVAYPDARVFSVSAKDRSAIGMGGQRPDGAYWLQPGGPAGFTTSRYYADALPAWVEQWNGTDPLVNGYLARVPEQWEYAFPLSSERPDDYPFESERFSRTSPHPLRGEDLSETLTAIAVSPFEDRLALEFTRELVRNEGLGRDDTPDLLMLSLSSTDRVGHLYGPESHESYDALRRLDVDLAAFFAFLEEHVGPARTLVALSSDHGVLPLPEWLAETGRSRCPVDGGRVNQRWMVGRLYLDLWREFSPLFSFPDAWVQFSGTSVNVDRALAELHEVDPERVAAFAERWFEARPEIEEAWTRQEIAEGSGEFAALYRHSFDPERSGDLTLQLHADCLISGGSEGTTHGSPYLYDRAVPIVFWGPGFERGVVPGRARTIDIAPTLARALGIAIPDGLDGTPLD
ncbi:MAG: alkaline phosphatase family protein [Deltaproteobacteria bacterium]|nr:alkaline phosphatase family protein [Deltaproteobacteria bacterium]